MTDLMTLVDFAVFVGELFLIVFGSLFVVRAAIEIGEAIQQWKAEREKGE